MTGDSPQPSVEARAISKAFGGVAALDAVDFEVRWSEVHALVGENGAGKTTLCNILAGIYRADAGQVIVDGVERDFRAPAHAIDAGIGMVHQHFRLVEPMTVAENIHLGWPETPGVVSQRTLIDRTERFMSEMGMHVDPTAKIWQLSVGEQQRVEILRVLARGARVLILDEPTAVLTAKEAEELFAVVRELAASGLSVIFITHKLREVLAVSDRLTVLRQGIREITRPTEGATAGEIARLMTGEERLLSVEHRVVTGESTLELRGVSALNDRGITALHNVDLTVRAGEILGIAGVSGNGQTELAEVICSLRDLQSGSIAVDGADVASMSVRAVTDLGVGHIPEDRIGMGMVLSAPLKNNAVLHNYWTEAFSQGLTLDRQEVIDFAKRLVEAARVQTRSVFATAGQLSGGNQQRLVARREALAADRLLVAAHPTRGLDVNAAQEVRATVLDKRDGGCAVLLISDDLDEVLLMSDRIAVMYEGRIMGVFDAADADREYLGLLMGGHTPAEASR
ncbi:MAG: ABC transporter ATP-binding protein [Acidimicrobiia bacterium]|nr:ABC transporter ATP-binding protein [Acidimicrobiia bacterium]